MSTPHPRLLAGVIVADLTATLEVIATVLLLAGAIGLGVVAFVWTRNWRRRLREEPTLEAQIESYRHMLNEGLIDDNEYDRIVAQLNAPPEQAGHTLSSAPEAPPQPPPESTP